MNLLNILWYSFLTKINHYKQLTASKKKYKRDVIDVPCYHEDIHVDMFYISNLLSKIVLVKTHQNTVLKYDKIQDLFKENNDVSTLFNQHIQYEIYRKVNEIYPDNLIFVEKDDELNYKIHLINIDVFLNLFVIREHHEKFQQYRDNIYSLTVITKEKDNFVLLLKIINDEGNIEHVTSINLYSNFMSILKIINRTNFNESEVIFNRLSDKFVEYSKNSVTHIDNHEQLVNVYLGIEPTIFDVIKINKIF